LWKYFVESGAISEEGYYKNDLKTGQWIFYYVDGAPESIGSFVADEKNALWGFFYPNDQLKQEQSWKNGRLQNVSRFYSIKGEELDAGSLLNGKVEQKTQELLKMRMVVIS